MLLVIHAHIHVHLPDVLMLQFPGFEVEEDKAFQDIIVENQIQVEVFGLRTDALLPRHKRKALAQFKQEGL